MHGTISDALESAIIELRSHQTQLDMDGVMVGVSRQALEEVLDALSASPGSSAEPLAACERCHKPVEYDLIVPDDVWARISPHSVEGFKGGGVLCPNCIVDALVALSASPHGEAGVTDAMRAYPDDLSSDLAFILGMPNFQCAPIAHAMRAGGADIATRSEDEQAFVLHWMIKLALDHPSDWRQRVGARLQEIADALASAPPQREGLEGALVVVHAVHTQAADLRDRAQEGTPERERAQGALNATTAAMLGIKALIQPIAADGEPT